MVLVIIAILLSGGTLAYVIGLAGIPAKTEDLSTEVTDLSSTVETMSDSVGDLASASAELSSTMALLVSAEAELASIVAGLGEAVGEYAEEIAAIEAAIEGYAETIESIEDRIKIIEEAIKPVIVPGEFHGSGNWYIPPAYHGNPYAPGGTWSIHWYVYEPLFYYLPGNNTRLPSLAESMEETEGGKVMTFHLREGVTWHDGEPFTSKDVRTSWAMGGGMWLWAYWKFIDSIETPDDYTVVFHLTTSAPAVKIWITNQAIVGADHIFGKWYADAMEVIGLKKQIWALEDAGEPVPDALQTEFDGKLESLRTEVLDFKPDSLLNTGTGPFALKKVTESEMYLEHYENHWAAATTHIDIIRIYRWPSNEVVWALLMAGEIDAAHPASTLEVAQEIMRVQPKTRMALPTDWGEFAVQPNHRKAPYNDTAFRKAVAHVLDRATMREVCYYWGLDVNVYCHGIITSLQDFWLSPELKADLTKYEHDTTKAESILTAAGYTKDAEGFWCMPGGERIEIELGAPAGYSDWVLACDEAARQLTEFGLKTEALPKPNDVYWPSLEAGEYDMGLDWGTHWWGTGHPATGFSNYFIGPTDNFLKSGFPSSETFPGPDGEPLVPTNVATALLTETDPAKQKELVEKLAWIMNENVYQIPYCEKRLLIYHLEGLRVEGWPISTDPLWSICGGGIERFYVILMTSGILTPVE